MIEINNISKYFGNVKAIENVSFNVSNGEIVGYVGLNGAGKTTTIRVAVGVLPPDSGDVSIDGFSITKNKRKASEKIGWVPELPIFETDFKALDYFVYLAGYYGLSSSEAKKMGKEMLERFGLENALNMKLSAFSQGMKKRFALAVSMINDPPNFIFDEVLNGLDPQGIAFFRDMAVDFKKRKKAILFSSHILGEVQNIADRVVFIHKGKVIGSYKVDEIINTVKPSIVIKLDKIDDNTVNLLEKYGKVSKQGEYVVISSPSVSSGEVVKVLVEKGLSVLEIKYEERSLEDFFFSLLKSRGE
ncbi:ABC transporter ATP-binding protein [Fervidicoccus fontis]|uniref:ABC transporter ATP-binding protein n=2 Tax=Fervidicoccus fontis TaxID=683846 RepID=A0A7C2ZDZ7_9CREN|nr:ABC transporter ATP-binding protein [Fervidicoccus fontis]HEW64250.1 ABC transporter ATP-binding protein [Fervidicoccus fontis]